MFNELLKLAGEYDCSGDLTAANQVQEIIKKIAEDGGDLVAQAKNLYREGYDLYQKGDYKNARIKFSIGFTLTKNSAFLFNMANCSLKMGDRDNAELEFEQYINSGGKRHVEAIKKFLGKFNNYEPEIDKLTNQISNTLKQNRKNPDLPYIREFVEKLFV